MNGLLKLLIAAALLNSLSWIILTPVWQYPDEQAHFSQVQDMAEIGYVPTSLNTSQEVSLSEQILETERNNLGNNKFTYHPEYKINYGNGWYGPRERELAQLQESERTNFVKNEATQNPPFYYTLASIFYNIFDGGSILNRVYAVRFMSALLFVANIYVAAKIGNIVFPKEKILAFTIPTLVAFKPMLVHASTGVLPDTLTNLLFSAVLLVCLKIMTVGLKTKFLLIGIVLITAGVFTRQQFLLAVPILAISAAFSVWKKKKVLSLTIASILIIAICLLEAGYRFASTPFISYFRIPELSLIKVESLASESIIDYLKWSIRQTIAQTLPWYWGVYKWLSLTVPHLNYQIINRIIIVSVVGVLLRYFLAFRNRKFTQQDVLLTFLIIASLVYFALFLVWDYFFVQTHNFPFGFQGRYFFPLVVAHITILLLGLMEIARLILKDRAWLLAPLLVAAMIIFNWVSLFTVASSYYGTSNLNLFIDQASQYKPEIVKGNAILLILLLSIVSQIILVLNFSKFTLKHPKWQTER
ncbi:MAG: DUF2142 domain-containing protein [Candidatus Curtissbacteria bacterium]|nr:DUF2142 domain-containing protein [Candidatus Curtissbacteria bacterium]